MLRRLAIPLFTLCSAALVFAACTADLQEGCVGGVCSPRGAGGATTGTGTGTGGMGGMGGTGGMAIMCDAGPATGDIPCEVFDVIHRNCNPCHQDPPLMFAPFPILTYEDTQMPFGMNGLVRYQRMNQVIRPTGVPHMPQGGKLTDADYKILTGWLDMCAPPTAEGMGCECPGMGCTALP